MAMKIFLTINLLAFAALWIREFVREGINSDALVFGFFKVASILIIVNLVLGAVATVIHLWSV